MEIIKLTDENFKIEILESDKLSLVDFWAEWCGPCLALNPIIEGIAEKYGGKINIGKVNIDENPGLSVQYNITSIPCILFIKNGELVDKQVGVSPKSFVEKKIQNYL